MPSDAPWAVRHFLEIVHPVGLYRALGLAALLVLLWATIDARRPARTIWLAVLGYALVHLVADAFVRDAALLGSFHQSQVVGLVVAIVAALMLAREAVAVRVDVPQPSPDSSLPLPDRPAIL